MATTSTTLKEQFNSRRSVVHSTKGIVSTSQPLATAAGIRILEKGGNAAMAAIASAAALAVLEPHMTGLGGDMFALFYESKTQSTYGINGSGRSPQSLNLETLDGEVINGAKRVPPESIHSVTVPGTVAGWIDVLNKWGNGKLTLLEILTPAIDLAEKGFPVSGISAMKWQHSIGVLKNSKTPENARCVLNRFGQAPVEGEIFRNPELANSLRLVAEKGKEAFYKPGNFIADSIVQTVNQLGGHLTAEDLAAHESTWVDPIGVEVFNGDDNEYKLWEIPPNGQGLVALSALGAIRSLDKSGSINLKSLKHNSVEYLHLIIENLRFAFLVADQYVSDPQHASIPLDQILSEEFFNQQAELFKADSVHANYASVLDPINRSDTVYLSTSDPEGNACSFINSVYCDFGSGIFPTGLGFPLQNRGANFNLTKGSRNCLAGGKRPYHTIIPAMVTKQGGLFASYGIMGGFNQPQAHVQVLYNMVLFNMTAQEAIDAPRICLVCDPTESTLDFGLGTDGPVSRPTTIVHLEEGIDADVVKGLEELGHKVVVTGGVNRIVFGCMYKTRERENCFRVIVINEIGGQIIQKRDEDGLVYSAGSDPRGDGCAFPLI